MNKPLLHQALDALLASRYYVEEVGYPEEIFPHMAAVRALEAELEKPDNNEERVIAELERLYKNAIKREFDLSQALEAAVDNNLDKLMAMTDEQIRSLAGFEGHHPDDLAALARQTCEIALLKNKQRNCSRHPDAPHGPDGAGCKCHSWAPGDAS